MQDKKFIRALAGFFRGRGIYAAALLCALAVGVSGVAYFTRARIPEPAAPEAHAETKPVIPDGRTVDAARLLPETPKPEPEPAPAPADFRIIMPVEGDLIRLYSMDHLSYNPTTRDWRTHDGIDIRAAVGADVRAAADGTVASVEEDKALGTVVTIRHAGGFLTRYGNLDPETTVQAGQTVRQGEVIGCVGGSALMEAGQESHLHFALCAGEASVNPTDYFAW